MTRLWFEEITPPGKAGREEDTLSLSSLCLLHTKRDDMTPRGAPFEYFGTDLDVMNCLKWRVLNIFCGGQSVFFACIKRVL